ncbi:uncharacterized protein LOC132720709 [Ruditapes philippinarum]|uniref:uncharacterized protein LOC132720709 n=1 Tax=Ruditapes philippinarum TaxID=129788 RepID=UPI00295C193C|nr:uncharacterized protein LOC132720709 [Ruditapes philippinarum]
MIIYAAVNYSYFALVMSFDHRLARDLRFGVQDKSRRKSTDISGYGATSVTEKSYKDSFQTIRTDLDKLFPEKLNHRGQHHLIHQQGKESHGQMSPSEPDFDATQRSKSLDNVSEVSDSSQVLLCKEGDPRQPPNMKITKQPRSWYSFLCNRWLSLFGYVYTCL